ncbi:hypothetical protein FRC12_020680, partial [Ceratobasidium sp. 428]
VEPLSPNSFPPSRPIVAPMGLDTFPGFIPRPHARSHCAIGTGSPFSPCTMDVNSKPFERSISGLRLVRNVSSAVIQLGSIDAIFTQMNWKASFTPGLIGERLEEQAPGKRYPKIATAAT